VPKISIGLKIIPFTLISCRDSMTNIAAKWLSTGIMGRAFLSTIEFSDRRIEPVIEVADLRRGQVGDRLQDPGCLPL
jgi:hypothetical protein